MRPGRRGQRIEARTRGGGSSAGIEAESIRGVEKRERESMAREREEEEEEEGGRR